MKTKLRLNRDTIAHLTSAQTEAANGGLTEYRTCGATLLRSCALSCGGTCFEITCAPSACF